MKKLLGLFSIISFFFFSSCADHTKCNSAQALLQKERDSLAFELSNRPLADEVIAEYKKGEWEAAKNWRESVNRYKVDSLNLHNIPLFVFEHPKWDFQLMHEYFSEYDGDFKWLSQRIANVLGVWRNTLKEQLENPLTLQNVFQENKAIIPVVLRAMDLTDMAKGTAGTLLPYFNGTAPKERIAAFDAFFAVHGDDGYIDAYDRDETDWNNLALATGLEGESLDKHYRRYLFAKRRMMAGGEELMKVCTEILQFFAGLS